MNLSGMCYYAKNVPDGYNHHVIIVALDDNEIVIGVPVSSIKENRHYDNACVISPGEIISSSGRQVIVKESFVGYKWMFSVSKQKILKWQRDRKYELRCKIEKPLLRRIQAGVLTSEEAEPIYQKYFIEIKKTK